MYPFLFLPSSLSRTRFLSPLPYPLLALPVISLVLCTTNTGKQRRQGQKGSQGKAPGPPRHDFSLVIRVHQDPNEKSQKRQGDINHSKSKQRTQSMIMTLRADRQTSDRRGVNAHPHPLLCSSRPLFRSCFRVTVRAPISGFAHGHARGHAPISVPHSRFPPSKRSPAQDAFPGLPPRVCPPQEGRRQAPGPRKWRGCYCRP